MREGIDIIGAEEAGCIDACCTPMIEAPVRALLPGVKIPPRGPVPPRCWSFFRRLPAVVAGLAGSRHYTEQILHRKSLRCWYLFEEPRSVILDCR